MKIIWFLTKNADMDHNKNLQHDVIAGVPNDDDPRPDIGEAGIKNDNLVGVPIAGVNDEQQQELENNETPSNKLITTTT